MVKKYIIMCGGNYSTYWDKPRHLSKVDGEVLVERTIRLLRKNGIEDISISTNYDDFEYLGVPILKHENNYRTEGKEVKGYWCDAFYPTDEPVCYLFGDVYFSANAIKTIVETETDDIEFFGSKPPFPKKYPKNHEEPFALKVVNTKHLKEAIEKTKKWEDEGRFWRKPLMWELWTVIKNVPLQTKQGEFPADYVAINDYTSDIDRTWDIKKIEEILRGERMIKVEAIIDFSLARFNEITNLTRVNKENADNKMLFIGDTFECNKNLADYLTGKNAKGVVAVKILEVIPEEEPTVEQVSDQVSGQVEQKPKATKKKNTRKK